MNKEFPEIIRAMKNHKKTIKYLDKCDRIAFEKLSAWWRKASSYGWPNGDGKCNLLDGDIANGSKETV